MNRVRFMVFAVLCLLLCAAALGCGMSNDMKGFADQGPRYVLHVRYLSTFGGNMRFPNSEVYISENVQVAGTDLIPAARENEKRYAR